MSEKAEFKPPFEAIKVAYYRGIGAEQIIAPLGRMNVFIGPNNAGKSIILNLLHGYLSQGKDTTAIGENEQYRQNGVSVGTFERKLGYAKDLLLDKIDEFFQTICKKTTLPFIERKEIEHLSRDGYFWEPLKQELQKFLDKHIQHFARHEKEENKRAAFLERVGRNIGAIYGGHWQKESREIAMDLLDKLPNKILEKFIPTVRLIPAIRNINYSSHVLTRGDLSGNALLRELLPLQNPKYNNNEDRKKFKKLNQFLKEVLNKENVILEVPHDNSMIQVNIDEKILPLDSLGTGIKEVVIIASYCTFYDGDIICLEEPEIHLHPALQRKLVCYLLENTSSQYFIATHSNIFMDIKEANLFQVTNDGKETHIKSLLMANEAHNVLDDLGYRASDILQINYIIWVEGPSDRVYLRHWMDLFLKANGEKMLEEGRDYSILFYGGALVKYLSAETEKQEDEEELEDFIKLLRINRNMTILLDRDTDHNKENFKPAVMRIQKELKETPEAFWITYGREVENYCANEKLQEAIKSIHSKSYRSPPEKFNQFDDHLFKYRAENNKGEMLLKDANKVELAKNMILKLPDWQSVIEVESDLEERIKILIESLKKANGIKEDKAT